MRSYPFTSQVTYDDEGLPLYDRAVDSAFLRKVFAQYFSDGIFYKPASALQVVADTGMQVVVEPGCCHIQGAIGIEDARRTLVVQAAEDLDRIDTVVARLDLSLAARDIDLYIVKGTAAASPQPPALTRDATVWELGLANLFVAKNVSTISQQRITDTRLDATRCGVVAQTIGALDTSPYFAQIQAALAEIQQQADAQLGQMEFTFDSWLETIKGKLGTDPATALQAQVDDLQAAAGGMPLELSAASNSVQMEAAENRLGNVTIEGFTTQAGTGDASPANVREIKNAGEYAKVLTFDGASAITSVGTNTKGLYRITIKTPEDFEIPDSGVVVDAICNQLKPVSATAAQFSQTYGYFAAYNGTWWFFVSGDIKDISSAQKYLSEHPIIVAYKSTEVTGKFYAGIPVEQGDSYHCTIVELKDRLHDEDTLNTNVLYEGAQKCVESHAKKTRVLTGTEYLSKNDYSGDKIFFTYTEAGAKPQTDTSKAANVQSNIFTTASRNDLLNGDYKIALSSSGNVLFRFDDSVQTVEEVKQVLAEKYAAGTPVVIEYELATPEVYADEPVEIKNPRGTFTVSGETGTKVTAATKPLTDADKLSGHTWDEVPSSPGDIGALPQVSFMDYTFAEQQVPAGGLVTFSALYSAADLPSGAKVLAVNVISTGWGGVLPQAWVGSEDAQQFIVSVYNATDTARTVAPHIGVYYYR